MIESDTIKEMRSLLLDIALYLSNTTTDPPANYREYTAETNSDEITPLDYLGWPGRKSENSSRSSRHRVGRSIKRERSRTRSPEYEESRRPRQSIRRSEQRGRHFMRFLLPDSEIGQFIGTGGEAVRRWRDEYDIFVDVSVRHTSKPVPERTVTIQGLRPVMAVIDSYRGCHWPEIHLLIPSKTTALLDAAFLEKMSKNFRVSKRNYLATHHQSQ